LKKQKKRDLLNIPQVWGKKVTLYPKKRGRSGRFQSREKKTGTQGVENFGPGLRFPVGKRGMFPKTKKFCPPLTDEGKDEKT